MRLNTPEACLMLETTDSPIALIRRFDRDGPARIPYISARTALQRHGTEQGAYTEIAQFIQQHSDNPRAGSDGALDADRVHPSGHEYGHHLKNHGFAYAGDGQWSLSQLFDVNPQPERHRLLKTAIIKGEPFEASLEMVMEAVEFFSLSPPEARDMAGRMARQIHESWQSIMRDHGVTGALLHKFDEGFTE